MAYLGQRTFTSFEKKARGWGDFFEEEEFGQTRMFWENEENEIKEKKKEKQELSNNEFIFREVKRTMRREGERLYLSPFTGEDVEPFSQAGIDANGYPKVIHNDKEQSIAFIMLNIMTPEPGGSFTAHYINAEGIEIQTVTHTYNPIRTSIKDGETGGHTEEKEKNASTIDSSLKDPSESISDEKPDEILFEKVPTHKWNSSGIKFYRRDGEPLSSGDVYKYITNQKKLGNQEFIDKFPRHIKGKDAEGTAPNFEIADSKYKYYNYSFDPEWGKKEEHEPTSDNYKDFKGEEVNQSGRISAERGLRILKKPDSSNPDNKTENIIPYGADVTVIARSDKYSPGFVYVRDKNGNEGWVQSDWVLTNVKEDSRIYHVKSGDRLDDIILSDPYYAENFKYETGNDRRTIVMAILLANKSRTGIYLEQTAHKPKIGKMVFDSEFEENRMVYQTIRIKEGHNIELPSVAQIKQWQDEGKIGTRSDMANFMIEVGRSFEGFIEGVGYGFVMGAADLVTGIWDLIESIVTGSIIGDIADLIDMLSEMGAKEIFQLIGEAILGVSMEDFEKAWNNPNPYKKWHFYGEVVGRIIFEVLIVILTGGGALAGKLGKLGKLNKIVDKMEDAKAVFNKKLGKKVDDLKKPDKVDEAVVPPVVKKGKKDNFVVRLEKSGVDEALSNKKGLQHGYDRHAKKDIKQFKGKNLNNEVLESWKKFNANILENATASFDNVLGKSNVKGFYKKVDGQDIAVYLYKEGPFQGKIATTVVLSPNQMTKFGLP